MACRARPPDVVVRVPPCGCAKRYVSRRPCTPQHSFVMLLPLPVPRSGPMKFLVGTTHRNHGRLSGCQRAGCRHPPAGRTPSPIRTSRCVDVSPDGARWSPRSRLERVATGYSDVRPHDGRDEVRPQSFRVRAYIGSRHGSVDCRLRVRDRTSTSATTKSTIVFLVRTPQTRAMNHDELEPLGAIAPVG